MPRKYDPQPVKQEDKLAIVHRPLIGVDPNTLLQRYLSDETTASIAASYGITTQALGRYLLRNAEEDWKEAQVARAIARKENAEADLEAANDPLALAKARELFKAAAWDLERTCKRIYGEDTQKSDQASPILNIVISNSQEQPALVKVSYAHAQPVSVPVLSQKSVAGEQQTQCNNGVVSDTSGS